MEMFSEEKCLKIVYRITQCIFMQHMKNKLKMEKNRINITVLRLKKILIKYRQKRTKRLVENDKNVTIVIFLVSFCTTNKYGNML